MEHKKGAEILNELLDVLNENPNSFSSKLSDGRSQAVYDILAGKTKNISNNMIGKIITAFPNVNRNFLLTGEGDILKDAYTYKQSPKNFMNDNAAPYYPNVNASAGLSFLTDNHDNNPQSYIKVPGLIVDAYINVFGDSMYPKYQSGQIVGIKRIEKEMVHFGYAYIVEMMDGESYIKYIQPGKDDEHWSLESENTHFKNKQFHLSKIRRVFKIKSVLTRESI